MRSPGVTLVNPMADNPSVIRTSTFGHRDLVRRFDPLVVGKEEAKNGQHVLDP